MTHQPTDVEAHLPGPATGPSSDRRTLLRVAGLTGVAGAMGVGLAACSSSATPAATGGQNTAGSAGSAGGAPTSAAGQTPTETALGTTSQIPVGGGMIFSAQQVVVTQPTAGTFKAFSSTCTHQGCQVNQVVNGLIECPCHGSHYSIKDGSVQAGPAPRPLPAEPITVKAGEIYLTA